MDDMYRIARPAFPSQVSAEGAALRTRMNCAFQAAVLAVRTHSNSPVFVAGVTLLALLITLAAVRALFVVTTGNDMPANWLCPFPS